MDGKFAKLSPFQVDPDKIPPLNAEDFTPAADEEKAAWEAEEHPTAEDIPAEEALDIITGRAEA